MNLKRYEYFESNDYYDFEFYSEGPKGRVKKLITFSKIPKTNPPIYNLAFGDRRLGTGDLDDKAITNN